MAGETNKTNDDSAVSPAAADPVPIPEGLEFEGGLELSDEEIEEAMLELEKPVEEPEKASAPAAPRAEPEVHAKAPEEPATIKPAPEEPKKTLPEPASELFGKDAIRSLVSEAGARYPLEREKLMRWAQGKTVLFWRDYQPIPLDELFGLSRLGIFYSEDQIVEHVDSFLKTKPAGPIFSHRPKR